MPSAPGGVNPTHAPKNNQARITGVNGARDSLVREGVAGAGAPICAGETVGCATCAGDLGVLRVNGERSFARIGIMNETERKPLMRVFKSRMKEYPMVNLRSVRISANGTVTFMLWSIVSSSVFSTQGVCGVLPHSLSGYATAPEVAVTSTSDQGKRDRVRIALMIEPFAVIQPVGLQAKRKIIAQDPVRHTLRARMDGENHFYFPGWHIESRPLQLSASKRSLKMQLTLYKRMGSYGEVEERVGVADVQGTMDGNGPTFDLIGAKTTLFKDKQGVPIMRVTAGTAASTMASKESNRHSLQSKLSQSGPSRDPAAR